ncbi:MAG: Mut7-C RNAse domain-containing protein [Deltaproteobacteria bacterium]|nr:Mut7-C RNAse domain-containing protein [Deltaproteobacteria bacterium]
MKLAADSMLGGLAKWLRLLGFDTYYLRHGPKEPMPDRILLTRRSTRPHQPRLQGWQVIINLSSNDTQSQLREVIQSLGLKREEAHPLTRCSNCNRTLQTVSKDDIADRVPEFVLNYHDEFSLCPGCERVYWPGTHHDRMLKVLNGLWDDGA